MISISNFLRTISVLGLVAFVTVAAAPQSNSTTGTGSRSQQPKLQQGSPLSTTRGGSIGSNNSSRVVLPAGRASTPTVPTSSRPALRPNAAAVGAKSNSTRVIRSTDESEDDTPVSQTSLGFKSKPSNSSGFVPSTHPLFANRQSSNNLTNSLRPKLRQPGSHATLAASSNSEEGDEDKAQDNSHKEEAKDGEESHVSSSVRKSVSSDSSESTIVSTGHVGIQSRNSTLPKVKASSGTLKARTSTPSSSHDEELSFF